jgi:hypothetical protein
MKSLSLLILIVVVVSACKKKDDPAPVTNQALPFNISYSDKAKADSAEGSIDHQNSGPKVTYVVDWAYVKPLGNDRYRVMFNFFSTDSLQMIIAKKTSDYNYNIPADTTQNRILLAIFNKDTMSLNGSGLSLQPRDGHNFNTVTNLNTVNNGNFNGTITKVPLINP